MKVITLPVGQMQSNCYLVIDEKTKEALIIDPGDDADFIIRKIQDEKAKPTKIIATHGHFDHIMAAMELKLAFSIPFFIHGADQIILNRHQKTAKYFLGIDVDPPPQVDTYVKEGNHIRFGREVLKVIETPGHTPGSICLYDKEAHILFSGDTIFAHGGVGRTDLEGGSRKMLTDSLTKIFSTVAPSTIIYPGHGDPTTIFASP